MISSPFTLFFSLKVSMVKVPLSGNTIYLQVLAMKGCSAILSGLNFFILMIISVA